MLLDCAEGGWGQRRGGADADALRREEAGIRAALLSPPRMKEGGQGACRHGRNDSKAEEDAEQLGRPRRPRRDQAAGWQVLQQSIMANLQSSEIVWSPRYMLFADEAEATSDVSHIRRYVRFTHTQKQHGAELQRL
jgi:hypothetical protein